MRALYTTVERVMRASDVQASAYAGDEILRAIESASDDVDALVKMGDHERPAFAPWIGSITFDWPFANNSDGYRFYLNQYRLSALTSITSGGTDITSSALLWPPTSAPYSAIDIDTAGAYSLEIGSSGTGQRSLAIAGTWGVIGRDETRSGWALGASADESVSVWDIDAPIGVGSLVLAGSERAIVTGRSWVASGQTASALAANVGTQSITVSDGSAFLPGEEIMIDAEVMLVRAIAGNVVIVQRAAAGSVLAAHDVGASVFWARRCTMERGVLGTTAAAHADGAAITIYRAPALVEQLTIAYAIDRRTSETTAYARDLSHIQDRRGLSARKVGVGVGGTGVGALQERVLSAYGRVRSLAI